MNDGLKVYPISAINLAESQKPLESKKRVHFAKEVEAVESLRSYRKREREVKALLRQSTMLALSDREQAKCLAKQAIRKTEECFPKTNKFYKPLMCDGILTLSVLLPVDERPPYIEQLKALGYTFRSKS